MPAQSRKPHNDKEFDTYRQAAPEGTDEDTLRKLIQDHKHNKEAIVLAIQDLWTENDRTGGATWETQSKTRKVDVPAAKPTAQKGERRESGRSPTSGPGDRGERGGRGRSLPPSSAGRGGGGRGRGGRSLSVTAASTHTEGAAQGEPVADNRDANEVTPETVAVPAPVPIAPPAAVKPAPAHKPVVRESAVPAVPSRKVWGTGDSLAEKLKRAEAEKNKPVVVEEPVVEQVEVKKQAKAQKDKKPQKKKAESLAEEIAAVTEETSDQEVFKPEAVPLSDFVDTADVDAVIVESVEQVVEDTEVATVSKGFLKMGKWDAQVHESVESNTLQFGSFGAINEDEPVATDSAWAQDSTSAASDVSAVAWGAQTTNADGGNPMGSIFPSSKPISGVDLDVGAQSRAPPGLESAAGKAGSNAINRGPAGQVRYNKPDHQAQAPGQPIVPPGAIGYQPYAGGNPPGIPGGRNVPAPNTAGSAPYGYNSQFDMSQQYPTYQSVPPVSSMQVNSGVNAASIPVPNQQSSAAVPANVANGLQPQQQYPPNAFPYYGNPYYPTPQYYYGQPQPNFYGQGRGYQPRPAYDPYGSNASIYPPEAYQGGQFPEGGQNYAGGAQGNSKPNKGGNPNSAPTAQAVNPQEHQNAHLNTAYGYGAPYPPPRGLGLDQTAWQYQQGQPGNWGPMGGSGLPAQGFSPHLGMNMQVQGNQAAQQGQSGQGNRSDNQQQGQQQRTAAYGSNGAFPVGGGRSGHANASGSGVSNW